jgi:hypothetical protein
MEKEKINNYRNQKTMEMLLEKIKEIGILKMRGKENKN